MILVRFNHSRLRNPNNPCYDCVLFEVGQEIRALHRFLYWRLLLEISLYHHQPINVPAARAQAFLMDYTQGKLSLRGEHKEDKKDTLSAISS
jgi:hypothetical protein